MAAALALATIACRGPAAPEPWRQPLPFVPERLEALGPYVVASARDRTAVLELAAGRAVAVASAVHAADVHGDLLAIVDRDRELLTVVAGGDVRVFDLKGWAPRDAVLADDGACVAVRGESSLLQVTLSEGAAALLYDRSLDTALPAPTFPAEVWARRHRRSARPPRAEGLGVVSVPWRGRTLTIAAAGDVLLGPAGERLPVLAVEPIDDPPERLVVADGQPEVGADPLVTFLASHPDYPRAASLWAEVGRRRRETGDTARAIDAFRQASRLAGGGPERDRSLDFELIELLRQKGDHEAAVVEVDRLLARLAAVPHDPAVFDASLLKAETLSERLHRPADAIPIFRELIEEYGEFFPSDGSFMRRDKARLYLGMALEKVGDAAEARAQYDAIIERSVTGTFVRYARERRDRLSGRAG